MSNSERIRPPWWLKYVNKVMIGLHKLGVGFGGKGPVVLTVVGRKTGKPRSTPVTPMTVDGKRYVVGGLPGGDWAANARAAGEVRCTRAAAPSVSAWWRCPSTKPGRCCARSPSRCRPGVGFMKNAGLVTGPNPDEFEALAGRCPVFRFDPVNA